MIYKIMEKESNKEYNLTINEIINLIKKNKENTFYKFIDNNKIKINNNIILKTEFICHRVNTVNELKNEIIKSVQNQIIVLFNVKSKKL